MISAHFGVLPRVSGPLAQKLAAISKTRLSTESTKAVDGAKRTALRVKIAEDCVRNRLRRQETLIATVLRRVEPRCPSGKAILTLVARQEGVSVEAIRSPRRDKAVCRARFKAVYEVFHGTDLSLAQIGKLFGGRDHTTIYHAIQKHALANNLPAERRVA